MSYVRVEYLRKTVRKADVRRLPDGTQLASRRYRARCKMEINNGRRILGDPAIVDLDGTPEDWSEIFQGPCSYRRVIEAVKRLPFQPLCSLKLLPSVCAVYFLVQRSECLYVGQAQYLRSRMKMHLEVNSRTSREYPGSVLHWIEIPYLSLLAVERLLIWQLTPVLNRSHNGLAVIPRFLRPATKEGRDYQINESDLELVKERPITGRPKKGLLNEG